MLPKPAGPPWTNDKSSISKEISMSTGPKKKFHNTFQSCWGDILLFMYTKIGISGRPTWKWCYTNYNLLPQQVVKKVVNFLCLQHYSRNLHDPLILKQEQIFIVKQISKPELIIEYLYIGHSLWNWFFWIQVCKRTDRSLEKKNTKNIFSAACLTSYKQTVQCKEIWWKRWKITMDNLLNSWKEKKGKSTSTPSAYVSFMNGRSNSTSCTPSDVLGSSLTT